MIRASPSSSSPAKTSVRDPSVIPKRMPRISGTPSAFRIHTRPGRGGLGATSWNWSFSPTSQSCPGAAGGALPAAPSRAPPPGNPPEPRLPPSPRPEPTASAPERRRPPLPWKPSALAGVASFAEGSVSAVTTPIAEGGFASTTRSPPGATTSASTSTTSPSQFCEIEVGRIVTQCRIGNTQGVVAAVNDHSNIRCHTRL